MQATASSARRLGYDLPNAARWDDERAAGRDMCNMADGDLAAETWDVQRLLCRLRYEAAHGRRYYVNRPDLPDGFQDARVWAVERLEALRAEVSHRRGSRR